MTITDGWEDLFHGLSSEFFAEICHFGDFIEKFASIAIFINDIEMFLILEKLKHFHNIRVILEE